MRPFSFKIILADHSNGDSYVKDCGFGFADTYSEAVKHLENAYGNQIVKIIHLEMYGDCNFIYTPESWVNNWSGKRNRYAECDVPCDIDGKTIDEEVIANEC